MKRLSVLLILFCMMGCTDRTGVPSDVIPQDSMQKIMADLVLASNYGADFVQKDSTKKDKVAANQELMAIVFKIHHTTEEEFKKSLSFYESRPDLSKKIFDSIEAYNNRHRKEDYKPINNNGPLHPGPVKPLIGPNGKPLVPINNGQGIPPHGLPLHPVPNHPLPNHSLPSAQPQAPHPIPGHVPDSQNKTPAKKTQTNTPAKQTTPSAKQTATSPAN